VKQVVALLVGAELGHNGAFGRGTEGDLEHCLRRAVKYGIGGIEVVRVPLY
jgi:hypothetical protein